MAAHWSSATRSWLISFFHKLTSHIPSVASSCNNLIPNHTTASASHEGASPTRGVVVDGPISVIEDVLPPINVGAIATLNGHGTRSRTTAGSSEARTFNSFRPSPGHQIASPFHRQELGKEVLGFAVIMTTGILFNPYQGLTHLQASVVVLALCVGFTTTWIGMLLRGMCPRFSTALECFGMASVLVAFFGLLSSFLPPGLVWACWLCCGLSCLPFLLLFVPLTVVEEERSAELLDEGIV